MDRVPSENLPVTPLGASAGEPGTSRGPWAARAAEPLRKRATDDREVERPRIVATPRPAVAAGQKAAPTPIEELANDILLDVNLLVDYSGFVVRAIRRHALGTLATLVITFGAIAVLVSVWPRTYKLDGRLLVQSTALVGIIVNPDRALSRSEAPPTSAAQEIVLSRDNLVTMVKDSQLLEAWDRTRTPVLRLKDRLFQFMLGTQTEERRIEGMVGLIEERLKVSTNDEGTVAFTLLWPDAQMGRQIVERAMQSFLEYRRVLEFSAINDSIKILEESAKTLETDITKTVAQLPRPSNVAAPAPRPVPRPVSGPSAESTVRLARLKAAMEARLQEVVRLEGSRAQQLAEAQARLSAAQTIYTEGHPTVAALKQVVAQLSAEPAELIAARRDARALELEFDTLSTQVGAANEKAEISRLFNQMSYPAPVIDITRETTDPVTLRLKDQLTELASVNARASAARAELASAKAGFKYQYSVVHPPQLPRKPVGRNPALVLVAGAIGSLMLALAFAVLSDLASGRVLEAWQVERYADAPVRLRVPGL